MNETNRAAKDAIEGAENKARSILAGAESRGRKYISTAEAEASEIVRDATREGDSIIDAKRRDAAALTTAARREAERVVSEAAENVTEYRAWLADILVESERLYRSQAAALTAAESAIAASREKLDSAFARLSKMQAVVDNSLNEDGSVKKSAPIRIESKRTRVAIAAPKKSSKAPAKKTVTKKKVAKKSVAKRK